MKKKISRTYPRINRREGGLFLPAEARSEDDGVAEGRALRRGRATQPSVPPMAGRDLTAGGQAAKTASLPTKDSRIGSKNKSSVVHRPDWDEYFLEVAQLVAKRSTCLRRSVGAVAVRDKRILATGYNGAPSGLSHCIDIGCLRQKLGIPSGERQELCRALHAEQNVIIQALIHKIDLRDSVIYVTNQPCVICSKMLISVGAREIIMLDGYPDELARKMLKEAKIKVRRIEKSKVKSKNAKSQFKSQK